MLTPRCSSLLLLLLSACATSSVPLRPDQACRDPSSGEIRALLDGSPIQPAPAGERRAAVTRNVVLIALDGVRWQEIFDGVDAERAWQQRMDPSTVVDAPRLLPHLHQRLVAGGVALGAPGVGAEVRASGPAFISLPGYLELLGGRPAPRCGSNRCPAPTQPTLLDEVRQALALPPEKVAVVASWERLERAASMDVSQLALSTGRHGGLTRDRLGVSSCASGLLGAGATARAAPGGADYRPDRYTAPLALEYLAAVRPRLLFVGLGDTDEYGHAQDYPKHLDALRYVDRFLGALFALLDRLGDYGAETTVLVTADHGWSSDFSHHGGDAPESGRVWLLAAGGSIAPRGLVAAAATRHLADVAPTVRALLGLPTRAPAGDRGRPIPELLPPPTIVEHAAAR